MRYAFYVTQNMKPQNPFLISGYYTPEYFCDRVDETNTIIESINNNRNVTLIGFRRIGKTGLIEHVFYKLSSAEYHCILIDILPTSSLNDFIELLANAIIGKLDSTPEKILKKAGSLFKFFKPNISFDAITGQPSVELNIKTDAQQKSSLKEIFEYLSSQNKKVVIAIDEFQQITQYPERNTEALLRTYIQQYPNLQFIFSGSHHQILSAMFGQQSRPFYQSTQLMTIDKINKLYYNDFILQLFAGKGTEIEQGGLDLIMQYTEGYTWYVQFLCNRIYSQSGKKVTTAAIDSIFHQILKENEGVYYNYKKLLTVNQWNLLKAVAKNDSVTNPTSHDFLTTYKLGAASSVNTAIKALLEKEMLRYEGNDYFVYDVFFSKWLKLVS